MSLKIKYSLKLVLILIALSLLQLFWLQALKEAKADFTMNLEKTEKGRKLMEYISSCALKEEDSFTVLIDQRHFEYVGGVGLAPEWPKKNFTNQEKLWVSACVLSRVNTFGITVDVSMRGPHPALKTANKNEKAIFPLMEAAFYGNIFSKDRTFYVCRGEGPFNKDNPWLEKRVCSERTSLEDNHTRCGFIFTGNCADVCEFNPENSFYNCQTPSGKIYREVITTYLKAN